MAKLIVHPGTSNAKEFELKPGSNFVGRGFANDLKLEDSSVSSSHAEIILDGGAVTLKDLGSTNGTFVNRLQVMQSALRPGQTFHLGGVELLLRAETAPAAASPLPVAAVVPTAAAAVPTPPPIPVTARVPAVPSVTVRPLPGGVRIGSEDNTMVMSRPPSASPSTPPQPPAPPPPIPAAAPVAASAAHTPEAGLVDPPPGKSACKFHPKTAGQWLCRKCNELYCAVCVITQRTSAGATFSCRKCGGTCLPVRVNFVAPKEKEVVVYSEAQLLTRSLLFGFGAAMLMTLIWTGFGWVTKFDVPFIFCILSGFLCGYAVKIAVQDQPSVIFSLIACGYCLVGVVLGKVGMVLVTRNDILVPGLTALMISLIGLVLGLFLAWKFGGGDF